jgi:hypothetical protein
MKRKTMMMKQKMMMTPAQMIAAHKTQTKKTIPRKRTFVPALQAHSGPRSLQKMTDTLPPNWREELRAQIAARVRHAALEGTWINELLDRSKTFP